MGATNLTCSFALTNPKNSKALGHNMSALMHHRQSEKKLELPKQSSSKGVDDAPCILVVIFDANLSTAVENSVLDSHTEAQVTLLSTMAIAIMDFSSDQDACHSAATALNVTTGV